MTHMIYDLPPYTCCSFFAPTNNSISFALLGIWTVIPVSLAGISYIPMLSQVLLFYIFNKKRLLLYISPVSICFWAIAIEVRVSDCNVAWSEWNSQLDTICNPIRTYHGIAHYKIPVSRKIFREGSSRFSVCHYNAPSV